MRYISQLNTFNRLCEAKHLEAGSQLLWFKLMDIDNRLCWEEWFAVTNNRLMLILDVNEKTLIRYRNKLIEDGLIEYKRGHKGKPSLYKMVDISCKYDSTNDSQNDSQNDSESKLPVKNTVQTTVQTTAKTTAKTTAINRHKTKTKDLDKECNKKNEEKVYFENKEVQEQFIEYLALRVQLKCKNTERAIGLLLTKLNKYSDDVKLQAINNAIMSSWKSVYPESVKMAKTETPNNVYAQLYAEAVASGEDVYEDPFGLDEPMLPEPEIEEAEIE